MTVRFKIALATLVATAATVAVVVFLLGAFNTSGPSDTTGLDEEGTSAGGDPEAALTADGAEPSGPGLSGTGSGVEAGSGGVTPGLREPHGLDLSDTEQREQYLTDLLGTQPVDWKELVRVLRVTTGKLPSDVRDFLLQAIRFGPRNLARGAFQVLQDGSLATDLLGMLDDTNLDARGRQAVLRALYEMPGASPDDVALGLESRLSDDFAKDRTLIQAIASRGGAEATRAVIDYIRRMEKPGLMNPYLLQGLDLRDNPEAQQVVLDAFEKTDWTPAALRQILGMVQQPGATAFTKSVISLDSVAQTHDVRMEALTTLGRIGGSEAIGYLLKKAGEPGEYGEQATKALKSVSKLSPTDIEHLVDELDRAGGNPRPVAFRSMLLDAIGNARARGVGEKLLPYLDDPSEAVSHSAIRAIGRMESAGQPYVGKLVERWGTAGEGTKIRLAVALGTIGGKEAVAALTQMESVEDLSPHLRRTLRMGLNAAKKRLDASPKPPSDGPSLAGQAAPVGGPGGRGPGGG